MAASQTRTRVSSCKPISTKERWQFISENSVKARYVAQQIRFIRFLALQRVGVISPYTNQRQSQRQYPKNFFVSIHRTSQAIKHKSAAILITIAATFCIIIIEQIFEIRTKPYKKIHILFIFLEILTSFSSLSQ